MILLDTHILVWWVSDEKRLSRKARAAIRSSEKKDGFALSAISMWEIAMLLTKGRLLVKMDPEIWLDRIEATKGLHIIPIDSMIARNSVVLPGILHDDPADRMIIATARILEIPLITADKKIQEYPQIKAIW